MIFYELKISYTRQTGEDNPKAVKETYLVEGLTAADVEERLLGEIQKYISGEWETKSCKQVQFYDLIPNPEGDQWYKARVEMITIEESGKFTEVYEAEATLKPVISRFEVDGFSVDFSTDPKFNKIEVTDIAFDHYYPTVGFSTAGSQFKAVAQGSHIKNPGNYESESDVFNWLNNSATTGWYVDRFESGKVVMVPDDPATTEKFENRADTPTPLAYHFFAGDAIPVMIIRVLADGNPAYLYTTKFKSSSSNSDISILEGGKIYRMSAAGVVDQTGGSVPIPDDLDPIKRCLDIFAPFHEIKVQPSFYGFVPPFVKATTYLF